MLKINHLTKRYGKLEALRDLNLAIEPGTVTVLLGPNGAGKSTLIKSVMGLLRYEGDITINGIQNRTPEARKILGYIPEMPALYPNLTVRQHLEFLARAYKLRDYKQEAEHLLEMFELSDKGNKFGDELSKGMQQKLNLCLGLLPDPEILFLDEPMIGLDPHAIRTLKEMIETKRAEGKTIFLSTHIIDSVDMLWDRALIMKEGVLQANVTRAELDQSGRTLEDLFFELTEEAKSE